jgi:hypothetical protein
MNAHKVDHGYQLVLVMMRVQGADASELNLLGWLIKS